MYRIFCESYNNFLNSFDETNARVEVSKPLELIVNLDKLKEEKQNQSELYKKMCDLVVYMQENIDRFPKLKAFLWTLSSRDIIGEKYNIAKTQDLEEQTKLVNSFLKLAYWY